VDTPVIEQILAAYKRKGYVLKDAIMRMNIFGIRNDTGVTDAFDDLIGLFYRNYNGDWQSSVYEATTDPGLYYLLNPMNVDGTGILCTGQHLKCWRIGKHHGEYWALVQNAPMRVCRDRNRDKVYDHVNMQSGMYGINCHRGSPAHKSEKVWNWSALCQVEASPDGFNNFMDLIFADIETNRTDEFDYALFDKNEILC